VAPRKRPRARIIAKKHVVGKAICGVFTFERGRPRDANNSGALFSKAKLSALATASDALPSIVLVDSAVTRQ
jgi:hypothetical protein